MKLAMLNLLANNFIAASDDAQQEFNYLAQIPHISDAKGFISRQTQLSNKLTSKYQILYKDFILDLSLWQSVDAIRANYTNSLRQDLLALSHNLGQPQQADPYVLWWVHDNHQPSIEEGLARLQHLQNHGATPIAFSLRYAFDAEEVIALEAFHS